MTNNFLQRFSWSRVRNLLLPGFGFLLSLSCLVFGVWLFWGARKATRYELTVSAGSPDGLRAKFIPLLQENFDDNPDADQSRRQSLLRFQQVPTAGSLEALEKVNNGQLDIAFVQGGLPVRQFANVRQVATMHVEAMHLVVKQELYQRCSEHLLELRGKTIATSPLGSGTNLLSVQILRFAGLKEGDYVQRHDEYGDLLAIAGDAGKQADVPDAVFVLSSLPSPVVLTLISQHGFRLVPLPIATPIRRSWLTDKSRLPSIDHQVALGLRRIESFQIPSRTYSIDPPRPDRPVETIGARLNLVANRGIPEKVVSELTRGVYETEMARVTDQKLNWNELSELAEFRLHAGTQKYLANKQPIATGQVIEVTEQLVGIVGALLGTLLFVWQWLRRLKTRRRDNEFVTFIDRVIKIENEAVSYEDDEDVPIERLQTMQEELSTLKSELIDRFRDGYLEGTEMLSSFLKHANDTSELISRIILHRMD